MFDPFVSMSTWDQTNIFDTVIIFTLRWVYLKTVQSSVPEDCSPLYQKITVLCTRSTWRLRSSVPEDCRVLCTWGLYGPLYWRTVRSSVPEDYSSLYQKTTGLDWSHAAIYGVLFAQGANVARTSAGWYDESNDFLWCQHCKEEEETHFLSRVSSD